MFYNAQDEALIIQKTYSEVWTLQSRRSCLQSNNIFKDVDKSKYKIIGIVVSTDMTTINKDGSGVSATIWNGEQLFVDISKGESQSRNVKVDVTITFMKIK